MTTMAMPTLLVYKYVYTHIKSKQIIILARRPRNLQLPTDVPETAKSCGLIQSPFRISQENEDKIYEPNNSVLTFMMKFLKSTVMYGCHIE